jgi:translation initiation factor 3 subunit D
LNRDKGLIDYLPVGSFLNIAVYTAVLRMPFVLPNAATTAEGWGPPAREESEIPMHAFKKDERFGRPSEFWGGGNPLFGHRPFQRQGQQQTTAFGGVRDFDEETGFTFVDNTSKPNKVQGFRRFNSKLRPGRGGPGGRGGPMGSAWSGGRGRGRAPQRQDKFQRNRLRDMQQNRRNFVHRTSSVEVRANWKVVAQFSLPDLQKMESEVPTDVKDIQTCGFLEYYDNKYDQLSVKSAAHLQRFENKSFHSVTTTEDPNIREIAAGVVEEIANGTEKKHVVFATDSILATMMAATRSVNSWDLTFDVVNIDEHSRCVFIDKRDDADYVAVNETARDPPQGEAAQELAEELLLVTQQFSQQVLKAGSKQYKPPNAEKSPFASEDEDVASALYRYRRWKLPNNTFLYARTQLDGVAKHGGGKEVLYRVYALLEYDPKLTDWRRKLESQAGAVMATEIKNNAAALAKWTCQSILSGADQMKLGYVARSTPSNRMEHDLLLCQHYQPMDFSMSNISLNPRNMWGIVRHVIDICTKLPEGKYILLKDPNKTVLYLYSVPQVEEEDEDADEKEEVPQE